MNGKLARRWMCPLVLGLAIALGTTGVRASVRAPTMTAPLGTASISFGGSNMVGEDTDTLNDIVEADLDNDGDVDLVAATDEIYAWENDGTPFSGLWPEHLLGSAVDIVLGLAAGDLDNDGDLDLVTVKGIASSPTVELWQNDGTPFAGAWTPFVAVTQVEPIYSVALGDLDNDGDLDLVTGESSAWVRVWENNGAPFAGAWTGVDVGIVPASDYIFSLEVGDLDNDGDLDIISGDWFNNVVAWRNNFSDPFGHPWTMQAVGSALDSIESLALGDLDGDGDLDVVAGCGSMDDYELISWRNSGYPFSGAWAQHDIGSVDPAYAHAVALGDMDVDGDLDVISGSGWVDGAELLSWENDGGAWVSADIADVGAGLTRLLTPDLDHDGDPDLVAIHNELPRAIYAWPNQHTPADLGGWSEGVQPQPADAALSVAVADMNHDGKLDLAAGTQGSGLLAWQGSGGYSWTRMGALDLPDTGDWTAVAWGQINNMAELDLAAASGTDGLMAWIVEEQGTLWNQANDGLPEGGAYQDVVLAHVDHDGQVDLLAGGPGGVEVYAGSGGYGSPVWQHSTTLGDPTRSLWDVAVGDVNRDGMLDVAGAYNADAGVGVWLGGGDLTFQASSVGPTETGHHRAVALSDLDHDGDDDLVAAPASGGVRVWMSDSALTWTETAFLVPAIQVTGLDLGDLDHDGDLDILASSAEGVHAWLGDGGVSWTEASSGLPAVGSFGGALFGRVDGDAHLDIVAAETSASGVRVWTAGEPPPGGWMDFQPQTNPPYVWETSQDVTASVQVADAGSGLDVGSAEYCFSTAGSSCAAGAWYAASCTGANGTTSYETITAANVPFGQDSADQNVIQFRIADMAGQRSTSPIYSVAIDSTPPTNPVDVHSPSHPEGTGEWSDREFIEFVWADIGLDNVSGIDGYSYLLTQNPEERPDEILDHDAAPGWIALHATSGGEWYLHFMTVDYAGNWSTPIHPGPYLVDTSPPTVPTMTESDPDVGTWTNGPVEVRWTADDDGIIAGYSYAWSPIDNYLPDETIDTTYRIVYETPPGDHSGWYLHVRAIDAAGNASSPGHMGPFSVDTTPPTGCWINAPRYSNNETCLVEWSYHDPTSGVATYDVQVKSEMGNDVYVDWLTGVSETSDVYDNGSQGRYWFRVSATDRAGNATNYECEDKTMMENLAPFGLEVTQGIQNLANEMAVIEGKSTYVRLYARSAYESLAFVDAELRGTRDGVPLPRSPLSPVGGTITLQPADLDREDMSKSFIFQLPPDWRSGTIELTAVVDPDDDYPENSPLNELVETVTFERTGYTCIVFVPVHLHPRTYPMYGPNFWPIFKLAKWLLPVQNRGVGVAQLGTMYPDGHTSGWEYGLPQDFDVILQDLYGEDFWHSDPCGDTHYYGMVHPEGQPGGWGMAYRPGDEASGVMNDAVGASWPRPVGGAVMAHELGHNWGRKHVWCNGCEKNPDRNYPYEEDPPRECDGPPGTCYIYRPEDDTEGYYGLLAPPGGNGFTVVPPSGQGDLMSYATRKWPSDWTYRALLRKIREESDVSATVQGTAQSLAAAQIEQDAQSLLLGPHPSEVLSAAWTEAGAYLYATGIIDPVGQTAELGRFYVTSDPERKFVLNSYQHALASEADEEAYSLLLLDGDGNVLYEHRFSGATAASGGNAGPEIPFAEVVPWVSAARIALRQGETELASRTVSDHAPVVTLVTPNGGETIAGPLLVQWTASDADGDELRYTIQYSADDGVTWQGLAVNWDQTQIEVSGQDLLALAGSDRAQVRVTATDGVNTGQDESDALFTLARHDPQAFITDPATMSAYDPGATIAFMGGAWDSEDGMLDDTAITWHSSLSGELGSGSELWVSDLPVGAHRITMTATDSDGQMGSDEITVLVGVAGALDIDPDTMNLKSEREWVTAYIELAAGQDVAEIDVSTVLLEGMIPAESHPTEIEDHDDDGIPALMVKFDWPALVAHLAGTLGRVELTVSGTLYDGTPFHASDTVRVID